MSKPSTSLSALMRECAADLALKVAGVALAAAVLYFTWSHIWGGVIAVFRFVTFTDGWPCVALGAVATYLGLFCKCVCQKYDADPNNQSEENETVIGGIVVISWVSVGLAFLLFVIFCSTFIFLEMSGGEMDLGLVPFYILGVECVITGWAWVRTLGIPIDPQEA